MRDATTGESETGLLGKPRAATLSERANIFFFFGQKRKNERKEKKKRRQKSTAVVPPKPQMNDHWLAPGESPSTINQIPSQTTKQNKDHITKAKNERGKNERK